MMNQKAKVQVHGQRIWLVSPTQWDKGQHLSSLSNKDKKVSLIGTDARRHPSGRFDSDPQADGPLSGIGPESETRNSSPTKNGGVNCNHRDGCAIHFLT